MATTTTNLGLTKPSGTDKIRIAQINGNMDILDDKIGAVGNTSLQAQVTSANEAIANKANFVSLGTFTETTFSDFLKAVCASYYSNSEADKAENFVATWSGHDYYTGMIRRHSTSVYCSIFLGDNIASCQYNATNQSILVNDINDKMANKATVIRCGTIINESVNVTLDSSGRYMIVVTGSNTARCAILLCYINSGGVVSVVEMHKGEQITYTKGNNNINITNTNADNGVEVTAIKLSA